MKGIIVLLFIFLFGCEHLKSEPQTPVENHQLPINEAPIYVSPNIQPHEQNNKVDIQRKSKQLPPPPPPVALPPKPAPPPSYKNIKDDK